MRKVFQRRKNYILSLSLSLTYFLGGCAPSPVSTPAAKPTSTVLPSPVISPSAKPQETPLPGVSSPPSIVLPAPSETLATSPPLVLPNAYAGPPEVAGLSQSESAPGQQLELTGRGLLGVERVFIGGQIAEIVSRTDTTITLRVPELSNGSKSVEIFGVQGRLADFRLSVVGVTVSSGGGGTGGGGTPTPNPLPTSIKNSSLITELPATSVPSGLNNFVPVISDQSKGQPRVSVPSRNLTTTVLGSSILSSAQSITSTSFQKPLVVGMGLNVEDDSFRVQTAFYDNLDPVFAYQGGPLPSSVDLRSADTAIRSQGGRGTCTFHAWAGLMDFLLKQANRYQGPGSGLSPQFLSWLYQEEVGRYATIESSPVYGQARVEFFIHTDKNLENPNSYVLLEAHTFSNDGNLQANIDQAVSVFSNSTTWQNLRQQGFDFYWYSWRAIQTGTAQTVSEGSNIESVGELMDANSPAVFKDNIGFTSNQGTVSEGFIPYPVPDATAIPAFASTGTRQQRSQNILGTAVTQSLLNAPVPVNKLRTYRIENQTQSLKAALSQGKPIVIGMPTYVTSATENFSQNPNASPWNMQDVESLEAATIDSKPTGDITSDGNHAVLLVGYRDQIDAPGGGYFIVRNSWGTRWGHQGYALISYDYIQQYAFAHPMTADLVPYDLQSSIDISESGSQMILQLTNVPSGTQQLALQIKAANLDPLLSVTPYRSAGQLAYAYRINVPPGTGREVTVSAYDSSRQLLGQAQLVNQSLNSQEQKTLTLNFQSVNNPPVIQSLTSFPASLAGPAHTAQLNCSATDPEGKPLTYNWSTPGGNFGSFTAVNGAQTFWKAPNPANSNYTLRCSVGDGTHTVTRDYSIAVANGSSTITGSGGLH